MKLVPIDRQEEKNAAFMNNEDCLAILQVYPAFYAKAGFEPPWIGYFMEHEGQFIGCGGYKGRPKNGTIEIAYGTFKRCEGRGVATEICRQLVQLALATDADVKITARTLPENNTSTRVLKRNGFVYAGEVWDEEDGNVWEWVYQKPA